MFFFVIKSAVEEGDVDALFGRQDENLI